MKCGLCNISCKQTYVKMECMTGRDKRSNKHEIMPTFVGEAENP